MLTSNITNSETVNTDKILFLIFFGGTGVWIQGLTLARQVLYYLSDSISLQYDIINQTMNFIQTSIVFH
jgi:hypothetical protein